MKTITQVVCAAFILSACAATRPTPDLHYKIDDSVLFFENQGALYAVTDVPTVERARIAARNLYTARRDLAVAEPSRIFPRETWDIAYVSTNGIRGSEPAQTAEQAAENSTNYAIRNDSMRFADEAAESGTHARRLEDDYARATKKLQKIFESAVNHGRARRIG